MTASDAPVVRAAPRWLERRRLGLAALVALVLAPVLWAARNAASDIALVEATRRAGTEAAYRAYLQEGWRYRDEVRRDLPAVALEEAKRSGTVTAVRGVLSRYPGSAAEADARAWLHRLYASALETFRRQTPGTVPEALAFVTDVLRYMEETGRSTIVIQIEGPRPDELQQAERRVAEDIARRGQALAPFADHFTASRTAGLEAAVATRLEAGFAAVLPRDVATLRLAETPDPGDPAIRIQYSAAPSGTFYGSATASGSERLYCGMVIRFAIRLAVPGSSPRDLTLAVPPPDEFQVPYSAAGSPSAPSRPGDADVYAGMASRAFDQLTTTLRSALFAPSSAAFRASQ